MYLITNQLLTGDPTGKRLMSRTLKIILGDNRLRAIFHRRHVKCTDRLKTGYQRMCKLRDAIPMPISSSSSSTTPTSSSSSCSPQHPLVMHDSSSSTSSATPTSTPEYSPLSIQSFHSRKRSLSELSQEYDDDDECDVCDEECDDDDSV